MKRAICIALLLTGSVNAKPHPKLKHAIHKVHETLKVSGEVAIGCVILAAYVYSKGH